MVTVAVAVQEGVLLRAMPFACSSALPRRALFPAGAQTPAAARCPLAGPLALHDCRVAKQAKDRLRLNLLAAYPPLRSFLRSELWPNDINFK